MNKPLKLCLMDWKERFHGFNFENNLLLHNNIKSVTAIEFNTLVDERQSFLSFKL